MTPDEQLEPLPCPFCGCKVIRQFHPFERRGYVIDCNRCNCGFHEINEADAVRRWNTRAPSSSVSEEDVERVARAMCAAVNADMPTVTWAKLHREERKLYEIAARAALDAMRAARTSE